MTKIHGRKKSVHAWKEVYAHGKRVKANQKIGVSIKLSNANLKYTHTDVNPCTVYEHKRSDCTRGYVQGLTNAPNMNSNLHRDVLRYFLAVYKLMQAHSRTEIDTKTAIGNMSADSRGNKTPLTHAMIHTFSLEDATCICMYVRIYAYIHTDCIHRRRTQILHAYT
jgi:hypothetical protein